MVSVNSAVYNVSVTLSPHYQSSSLMYIRGLIPWNFAELTEAVPIDNAICRTVLLVIHVIKG